MAHSDFCLGVTFTLLTCVWDTQRFEVDSFYPDCSKAIGLQWQHSQWINQNWPNAKSKRDLTSTSAGAGPGILGQAGLTANEERFLVY